jgi:tetratricopeptide (TPR) repeat protein
VTQGQASSPAVAGDAFQEALACYEAGDIGAAAQRIAYLLQASPHRHEVLHLAGDVALKQQRPRDAMAHYQQAIQKAQDNDARAFSWYGLSRAARDMDELPVAEDALQRASLLAPQMLQYVLDLSQVLSDEGKFEPALETLRALSRRRPRDPMPYWAIGTLLMQWQRQADALAAYEIALAIDETVAPVYVYAGAVHQMHGRHEEAEKMYRQALKLDPASLAFCQMAQIKKFAAGDTDIAAMETRFAQDSGADTDQKIDAAFALAKAYDDIEDYEHAYRYLALGNDLRRDSVNYDVTPEKEMMDRIIALFTNDFLAHYRDMSDSALAPIFIVGMPRSGTTLVEQMLAAHSAIRGGGELTYVGRLAIELGKTWQARGDSAPGDDATVADDLRKAANRYAGLTADLHRRYPRFTDKMPQNFLYIGLIQLLFPKSTIIHCQRDPVATCFSCYQKRFTAGNYFSFDLGNLGQYYGSYERIMRHWHQVLPDKILDVRYEDMVADPEKGIRRILEFCKLEFEPGCLNFQSVKRAVATASNAQVRKPIYKSSIEHWRHYKQHLGPLFASLQESGVQLPEDR